MLAFLEKAESSSGHFTREARPYRSRDASHNLRRSRNPRSQSPGPSHEHRPRNRSRGPPRTPHLRVSSRSRSGSPKHGSRKRSRSKPSRSACPLCLGRFPHDVRNCDKTEFWDGPPTRCHRNPEGRLVNPTGQTVCTDWQRPFGCRSKHAPAHECSGCGDANHGAQACPRAQKG
jgi:hypothetical protein